MTVVCYRPDPTYYVDEKLNYVEACSFDGVVPFSLYIEPLQQTQQSSSAHLNLKKLSL